jgi:hypothetical protein
MSLDTGRYQLYSALKVLRARWDQTQDTWDDLVRRKFGEDVFEPLEQRTQVALTAIDRLAQVVTRLKQECS